MIYNENKDLELVSKKVEEYINIIIMEYGKYINNSLKEYLVNNNNLVKWNNNNTISFLVKNNILLLPKNSYKIFEQIEKLDNYGIKKDIYNERDYLNTNTTYYDYINHVIEKGLKPIDYFLESLLHESMHICGSTGGYPLEEGINELKTRELATKYHINIAAMGYSKEVEIAKRLQLLYGKEIFDELTFIPHEKKYMFLEEKCGEKLANLYFSISNLMAKEQRKYRENIFETGSPFVKAKYYEMIDYSKIMDVLTNFEKQFNINSCKKCDKILV